MVGITLEAILEYPHVVVVATRTDTETDRKGHAWCAIASFINKDHQQNRKDTGAGDTDHFQCPVPEESVPRKKSSHA